MGLVLKFGAHGTKGILLFDKKKTKLTRSFARSCILQMEMSKSPSICQSRCFISFFIRVSLRTYLIYDKKYCLQALHSSSKITNKNTPGNTQQGPKTSLIGPYCSASAAAQKALQGSLSSVLHSKRTLLVDRRSASELSRGGPI
jgi:hypothetical protein